MKLKVNTDKRTLLRDKKPFFLLADTCWSAFTNINEKDWEFYLDKRKEQGFNTLQINILPQWDRSKFSDERLPFNYNGENFDFSIFKDSYFKQAKKMCDIANNKGFSLALVVLWSNYVTGTWASKIDEEKNIFPKEHREKYFKRVIETFDEFFPMYIIGGDTDFPERETVTTYVDAFKYFKEHSPDTLKTIHIKGRMENIPSEIRGLMDLYLYQSGHNSSFNNMPYYLAQTFYQSEPRLPVINSEPCYEQMGFARKVYGRFTQKDVRKAAWQSILSGACAGVTYGAHGIWSWHESKGKFSNEIGEAFDYPMLWQEALQLPGANDYGFINILLQILNVQELIPKNDLLVNGNEQIRLAANTSETLYIIYMPSVTKCKISRDLSDYDVTFVDLAKNRFLKCNYEIKCEETTFEINSIHEDVLIIMNRSKHNG